MQRSQYEARINTMRQTRDSMFCVSHTKTTSVQKTKIKEHYCFATVQTNRLPALVGEV